MVDMINDQVLIQKINEGKRKNYILAYDASMFVNEAAMYFGGLMVFFIKPDFLNIGAQKRNFFAS